MTELERERHARREAEQARDALAYALKPFALIADRDDLKSAIPESMTANDETFELPSWFERICERARYAMHAKAPSMMGYLKSEDKPGLQ